MNFGTPDFRQIPTERQGLVEGQRTSSYWYRYLQSLELGAAPGLEVKATVTASPFSFTAPRGGTVFINGGTVSVIALQSRTQGGAFYTTGLTKGSIPVSQNDVVKITYSGAPAVVFYPS